MKLLKKIIVLLIGKFARSHEQQIKKAQWWIDSAQSQFASALEQAEIAEKKFEEMAKKKIALVDKMIKELNEAEQLKAQAKSFKEKMQKFLED